MTSIVIAATTVETFSVLVVDGSGREVCGESVTARFAVGDVERTVTRPTGPDGEARFAEELAGSWTVTLTAAQGSLGPIRPKRNALLVIET